MDLSLLGFPGLDEVLSIHPVFVHFPIALFPSALLLYSLGIVMRRRSLCVAGRACLYLAAVSTAVTIATGLIAQRTIPHNARIHHIMQTHEQIAYLIGALSLLLVGWSFAHRDQRPKASLAFLGGLLFVVYLVLQNGDLGGRMVFIEGAGVKAAVPAVESGHQHGSGATGHGAPGHHDEPAPEPMPHSREEESHHDHGDHPH